MKLTLTTILIAACLAGAVARADDTAAPAPSSASAAEAGVRYGQAVGVALMCYGLKTTEAAEKLEKSYSGTDAAIFRAEADKVIASWQDAAICRAAGGPNSCRLAHEWSCRDALREIGPEGNRFPGLVMMAR